jgi:transposase
MTWYAESIPPVPDTTAAMVKSAFPQGHLDVDLHTEFGAIYADDQCADLSAKNRGRRVEVAPWRLALVTVMQYMEGLSDRQAADAVRRWVVYLSPADKYHRFTRRLSKGQKVLQERALLASQRPSEPW